MIWSNFPIPLKSPVKSHVPSKNHHTSSFYLWFSHDFLIFLGWNWWNSHFSHPKPLPQKTPTRPRRHAVAPVEERRRQDAPGARGTVHGEGVDGVVHLRRWVHGGFFRLSLGKSWENHQKILGKSSEKHGEIIRNSFENNQKILGKSENHRKIIRNMMMYDDLLMGFHWILMGCYWDFMGKW